LKGARKAEASEGETVSGWAMMTAVGMDLSWARELAMRSVRTKVLGSVLMRERAMAVVSDSSLELEKGKELGRMLEQKTVKVLELVKVVKSVN
jgi:hypothetical protein